jgi:hypothetical protein
MVIPIIMFIKRLSFIVLSFSYLSTTLYLISMSHARK